MSDVQTAVEIATLTAEIKGLRHDLTRLRDDMPANYVRADVHGRDIAAVRAEIGEVRADLGEIKTAAATRLASNRIIWSGLAAAVLSAAAAVIAAITGH